MKDDGNSPRIGRRDFVRSCAALMALGLQRRARSGELAARKTYTRAHLVDDRRRPFRVRNLEPGQSYLFHYPFVATPCFLINLGQPVRNGEPLRTESGQKYRWPGGVGPGHSVVAFSAICSHKMTHPAKSVSFINYRPETITYINNRNDPAQGRHLIYCCSERSVYDARDGARVLGGPAGQPLAAIGLEYVGASDSLFATGTFGGEMFEEFFATFRNRLQLAYKVEDVSAAVGAVTFVQPIDDFTDSRILC